MLGIDFGTKRIGVAAADLETRFARPLEVIDATEVDPIERIAQLVTELEATLVVVGKPVGLSGKDGPAVEAQSAFLHELRDAVSIEIAEHDERLTTVVADQQMRAAGLKREAKKKLRDAIAAQVMLQGYLDGSR
jgi:putative Holliday junction resolvase